MFEEVLFATANGARLGTESYLPGKEMSLDELDGNYGFVDYPSEDGGWDRIKYDTILEARLAFGLWRRAGPYDDPSGEGTDPDSVPLSVAVAGKSALVAYLLTTKSGRYSKRKVADELGIVTDTVRNHENRVRTSWSDIATLPDRVLLTRSGTPIYSYEALDSLLTPPSTE